MNARSRRDRILPCEAPGGNHPARSLPTGAVEFLPRGVLTIAITLAARSQPRKPVDHHNHESYPAGNGSRSGVVGRTGLPEAPMAAFAAAAAAAPLLQRYRERMNTRTAPSLGTGHTRRLPESRIRQRRPVVRDAS